MKPYVFACGFFGGIMWECPKCGRMFKRINQGHYCGKAPENVQEYIAAQENDVQGSLCHLREIILSAVPAAKEKIAWSMPYFICGENAVSFAAFRGHISLYADEDVLIKLGFSGFVVKKSAIYLPYDKEWPEELLKKLVKESLLK